MDKGFVTKEQYVAFREAFRKLAREKKVDAQTMLIFHTIRGKGPYFGFTPVSNPRKLHSNCADKPWFNHEIRINGVKNTATSTSSWAVTRRKEIGAAFNHTITPEAWSFLIKNLEGEPK